MLKKIVISSVLLLIATSGFVSADTDLFLWKPTEKATDGWHWSNAANWSLARNDTDTIPIPSTNDEVQMTFSSDLSTAGGGATIIYDANLSLPISNLQIVNTDNSAAGGPVYFIQNSTSVFKANQVHINAPAGVVWEQYGGSSFEVTNDYSPDIHNLYNGSLTANAGTGIIGGNTLNQSGGQLNALVLSSANYYLSNGSANADEVIVGGQTWDGHFTLTGGHLNVSNRYASDGSFIKYGIMKVGGKDSTGTVELSGNGWLSMNPVQSGLSQRQLFNDIQIGGSDDVNQTSYFIQNGNSFVEAGHVDIGYVSKGEYLVSSGKLEATEIILGHYAQGLFTQNGGSVEALALPSLSPGPTYDEHARGALRIGINSKAAGSTYILNGGGLVTNTSAIGELGNGFFEQNGGTHTVNYRLTLGDADISSSPQGVAGVYTLKNGLLETSVTGIGRNASQFLQTGGTHNVGYIGDDAYYNQFGTLVRKAGLRIFEQGSYIMTGGLLQAKRAQVDHGGFFQLNGDAARMESTEETIAGRFNHLLGANVSIALKVQETGLYELWGSTAQLTTANTTVDGIFDHRAGTHTASGSLDVSGNYKLSGGELTSRFGTVTVDQGGVFQQTGGSNTSNGNGLVLGATAGTAGTYNLVNGILTVSSNTIVGQNGNGTFNQTGGRNTISGDLVLGSNSGATGMYNLNGIGLAVSGKETIGEEGTGTFNQSAGIHTVTGGVELGQKSTGSGTLNVNGGILSSTSIKSGQGFGRVNLNDGAIIVDTIETRVDQGSLDFNFVGGTLAVKTYYGGLENLGGRLVVGGFDSGMTTIDGNFNMFEGLLDFEISDSGFDFLNVLGDATFTGGDLHFTFDLTVPPALDDQFMFMRSASFLNFDLLNIDVIGLGDDFDWWIIGGSDEIGEYRSLVFDLEDVTAPVPEPSTILLLGSGLVGLVWYGRKRKKSLANFN